MVVCELLCGSLVFELLLFVLIITNSGAFIADVEEVSVCDVGVGSDAIGFGVEIGVNGVVVTIAVFVGFK